MSSPLPLITRYFQLASGPDTDAYFAQFAEGAKVEDEGTWRRGIEAIRAWRTQVPSVDYDLQEVASDDGDHTARVEISGTFPGSPVVLRFTFRFTTDGRIEMLRIRT